MSDTLLPQIAQHLSKAGDAALTIPRLQAVVAGFLLVEAASEGATTAIRNAEKAIDAAKTGAAACVEAYGAAQIARIEFGKQLSNLNLTA